MKYKLGYFFSGCEGNYSYEHFDTKEEASKRREELYKQFGSVVGVFIEEVV